MLEEDMVAVEKLRENKYLYKIVLYLIKVIPIITSLGFLINTILSYFCVDLEIFAHLCGVSIFTIIFFYLTSIAFHFCRYHRMFIHYITLTWLLRLYDYYIGIPSDNLHLLLFYLAITGIFLFIILYEHQKTIRRVAKRTGR